MITTKKKIGNWIKLITKVVVVAVVIKGTCVVVDTWNNAVDNAIQYTIENDR